MRSFDELLREAVAFHGHLCPGQVLGVRMVLAGCRALGVVDPKSMQKSLVVFVEAVRVSARDDAREKVLRYAGDEPDRRRAQMAAYRVMPEEELLRLEAVSIHTGWLDRRRVRVACRVCGEGVSYGREVLSDGLALCRACFDGGYYWVRAEVGSAKGSTGV
jgi:formylmethanofuran dehydrogenase subunit E